MSQHLPPVAAVRPVTRTFHGRDFVDNYEWLREKDSPETLAYLEAENAYTQQQTAHIEPLTENIYQELKSRIKETDMSVPMRKDDYWYYTRSIEGQNYGLSCRMPVSEGDDPWFPPTIVEGEIPRGEEILLDGNELAQGHEFFSLGASAVSESSNLLAYSVDFEGSERFTLKIKDLRTGQHLDDELKDIHYGVQWVGDDYIFYTTANDAWRSNKVWRHKVGQPQSADTLVYEETDEYFNVGVYRSLSNRFLIIGSQSKTTSEARYAQASDPEGEFTLLWPREAGVEYDLEHANVDGQDYWVVTHNATGPNSSVGFVPIEASASLPALRDVAELVPHRDDVRIEGVSAFRDHIVMGYRKEAISRAAVMDVRTGWGEFKELTFDEELYDVGVGGMASWDAPVLRVSFTSYIQPSQLFLYRVDTGEFTLLREREVQGGYNKDDYVAYRMWTTASDGAQIPVSIVHRADLDRTQPNPLLLYAYGSYESSMDPYFSILRLSMMDRGVIFAVAHVRGGGEMGRAWYDEGKLLKKMNTFTDFIAVADDLIVRGVTTPQQLAAEGGSAGGLLMGAVANMAPDLFRAIQASVPFVDALTSILKPELPLTVIEWEEWGDPFHDPEVYDYMKSYTPYENVVAQDYPDILALTSLNDTRVLYVEPAKWIAQLRATATGGEFCLKTEMVAGHGGVSGRYDAWRQGAFETAWTVNKITGVLE